MFYYTYVLKSDADGNLYTGYTKDLKGVPGVAPSQVTVKMVNIVKIHAYRGQYGIF